MQRKDDLVHHIFAWYLNEIECFDWYLQAQVSSDSSHFSLKTWRSAGCSNYRKCTKAPPVVRDDLYLSLLAMGLHKRKSSERKSDFKRCVYTYTQAISEISALLGRC